MSLIKKTNSMKTILLTIALFFGIHQLNAQITLDVNVTGIDPQTEKNILPGDMISYWQAANGDGHQNFRVRVSGENGKDVLHTSLNAKPDENGHYTFNHKVSVTEGQKFSFEEELKLLIYCETIFGNVLWTEVTRNKANFSDPIILDRYTWRQGKNNSPISKFVMNFYYTGNNNGIKEKLAANNDNVDNRKITDFRFYLKNVGDTDWKVDKVFETGQTVQRRSVRVNILFDGESPINLDKKIVVRAEAKTEKGNIVWHEAECEARELRTLFWATDFTLKEDVVQNTAPQAEDKPNPDNKIIETAEDTKVTPTKTENTSKTTEETPVIVGATDLTTKTTIANCKNLAKGDTLISLNGSKVCVRAIKPQGAKALVGTLAFDCNFLINGTIFPVKGNEEIKCHKSNGNLVEGVLRANTSFESSVGTVVLKENTIVRFKGGKLMAGSLAENTKLNVQEHSFECTPNTILEDDIRFDVQGRIVEFSLASAKEFNANVNLTLPKLTRLIYKNGVLNRAVCMEASSFVLDGKTITVAAHNTRPAYVFDNGIVVSEVYSGKDNSISIQGQDVPMKEGTKIKFELDGDKLEIVKFFTASAITLNVPKGKSTKAVNVKAGKKVVLKNGVVVKAG